VLIPPSTRAPSPAPAKLLKVSALLSPLIGPVFESNENNTFACTTWRPRKPGHPGLPEHQPGGEPGRGPDWLFWQDFFQDNVQHWERYYQDAALRERVGTAGGLADHLRPALQRTPPGRARSSPCSTPCGTRGRPLRRGGGRRVSLAKIVENILSVHVAQTGYAVLLNGKGEIVTMSEQGREAAEGKDRRDRAQRPEVLLPLPGHLQRTAACRPTTARSWRRRPASLSVPWTTGRPNILVFSSLEPINDTQYAQEPLEDPDQRAGARDPGHPVRATPPGHHARTPAPSCWPGFRAGIVVVVIVSTFFIAGTITKSIGQLSLPRRRSPARTTTST